jgi:pyruvate ferredoxin oxidoreductase gamma subunit
MFEMRFHGRGGQGAVTSAELTAQAAIAEGKYGQAFPSFGPERRGAPVMAFARASDEPIRNRSAVYTPDAVLVLDASLLYLVDVGQGLQENGTIVINSGRSPDELRKEFKLPGRLASVDALTIAMETIRRPITNTTMLGALVKATAVVGAEALEEAINNRFGPLGRRNIAAMRRAIESVKVAEPS